MKIGFISDAFVKYTSDFVYKVSLPALIFVKLSVIPVGEVFDVKEIGFVVASILLFFGISWRVAYLSSQKGADRGAMIQGSYRSNFAIVGLALIGNMYGEKAVGHASLILAFAMPLFNILAVIALSVPLNLENKVKIGRILTDILKNPLILAIFVSLPFSYWHIYPGIIIMRTGNYLASIALPLALIGIGASLKVGELYKASGNAWLASLLKIFIFPLLGTFFAYGLGFRGENLGILFILFASPTAIVSYVMASSMGANSRLAGNIIVLSTLGSVFTISIGVALLKYFNLI